MSIQALKGKLTLDAMREFWASSPDVGEGVAGMRIARDSEHGILAVYRASDTYNFEDGTGKAGLLIKIDGSVILTDAKLNLTGVGGIYFTDDNSLSFGSIVFAQNDGDFTNYLDFNLTVDTSDLAHLYAKMNFNVSGLGTAGISIGAQTVSVVDLFATNVGGTRGIRVHSTGGVGIGETLFNASSLLHLKSTAPTFRMEDSTANAKSLLVKTDANLATFEEAGGAANNLLVLDLANTRMGIGTAAPSQSLDVASGNVLFAGVNAKLYMRGGTGNNRSYGVYDETLANNGTTNFGSGFIGLMVFDGANGKTCLVMCRAGGAVVDAVFNSDVTNFNIGADAGLVFAIYYSGGSYYIKNRSGANRSYVAYAWGT